MDNNDIQLVGGPCGQHGPYTFYKAFKYTRKGVKRVIKLSEFFFVKLWIDSDLVCIGELQLLWVDKNSEQLLSSLRLYFLPENTPDGRMDHGEDEVLAIAEKVVLKVEDLITWITVDTEWTWGKLGRCHSQVKVPPEEEANSDIFSSPLCESSLDFSDVEKERNALVLDENLDPSVIILSYPRYCRYRAMMRRLEGVENEYLKYRIVTALGGFTVTNKNTRVLFCRDTFEYPELEGHEMLCNHLAPKLKGRPRGKRKKRSVSPGSESNESESSVTQSYAQSKDTASEDHKNGMRCDIGPRRSTRSTEGSDNKDFLKKLTVFMKTNHTPLGRIPSLGYKELDLYSFYTKVQKLGGYDSVTANRLWKSIFEDMSGHQNSTSAATVIRRHYERFLLSYERHTRGEEYKPLSISERRRLKSKTGSSTSDAETSESNSTSGTNTPTSITSTTPVTPTTPTLPICTKDQPGTPLKTEAKVSSLRSVRVKPERQKDKLLLKTEETAVKAEVKEEEQEVIKVEFPPIELDLKEEKENINTEPVSISLIDKKVEPITTAVAPVVEKVATEMIPSPMEGKENVPIAKPDSVEAKTPEKDELQQAEVKSVSPPFIHEIKKRKLEILKEGGLEVTPVRTFTSPSIGKDIRPSVIQQPAIQHMPPPSINNLPSKKLHLNIPQSLNISQISVQQIPQKTSQKANLNHKAQTSNKTSGHKTPTEIFFNSSTTPPKVVQSKSIYTYSENTVYGNPKEYGMPNSYFGYVPKSVPLRQTGGEILDLTVSSPQKPIVEIKKVPNIPQASLTSSAYREMFSKKLTSTTSSLLEGRKLGSNLEITLVGPTSTRSNPVHLSRSHQVTPSSSAPYKSPHKRLAPENYNPQKFPKFDENGKYHKPNYSSSALRPTSSTGNLEISIPNILSRSPSIKSDPINSHLKINQTSPSSKNQMTNNSVFPPYISQLYEANKLPPYMPMIDPIYYSAAMQSLYPHNAAPPLMPFTSPEHLKFYSELMAQTTRLPFPFHLPQDVNHPSLLNSNLLKKP